MYFWACDMRNPGGSSFVEVLSLSLSCSGFFFNLKIICRDKYIFGPFFCPMSGGII